MAWVYLIVAGVFEVVWAFGLKQTDGWTKLYPSLGTLAAMIVSFQFLSMVLKTIPLGTGYAVWTGIGAVGTAIVGMVFLGEAGSWSRILCILLIVPGIVSLKLTSSH